MESGTWKKRDNESEAEGAAATLGVGFGRGVWGISVPSSLRRH